MSYWLWTLCRLLLYQVELPLEPGNHYRLNNSVVPVEANREALFTMGVNTIIGMEYRWLAVPMTIGADLKPFFEFIGMRETEFKIWDAAISVKYVF